MITISSSVHVLITGPTAEPRVLLDLTTQTGTAFHYSTEAFSYGGTYYEARLQGTPEIQTALGPAGIVGARDVSIPLANADGFFAQHTPGIFRAASCSIRQVFRECAAFPDANSLTLWGFNLMVTGAQLQNPETFELQAGDMLSRARRTVIPNNDLVITQSLFPGLPEDSPGLGKPVPVVYGLSLVPMYLVGENVHSEATDTGAACHFTVCQDGDHHGTTRVYQLFNNDLVTVNSAAFFTRSMWNGHQVLMVRQASSPRIGGLGELVPHFALVSAHRIDIPGDPAASDTYPDICLLDIFTNSYLGNLRMTGLVDSANWASAHSVWYSMIHVFNGVLTEQRPLEQVLDDWAYSAMAHLSVRDKLRIVVQAQSRAAVYSFHTGNILQKTLTWRERALSELETTQTLLIRKTVEHEVTNPALQGIDGLEARTLVTFNAGSDGAAEHESVFLGWVPAAKRATQLWAKRESYAVREYELQSTIRAGHVEEGDLVSLVHTLYVPGVSPTFTTLGEVVGITRGDTLRFQVHGASPATFAASDVAGGSTTPQLRAAFVRYGGGATAVDSGGATFTSSHPITNRTPSFALARVLTRFQLTTLTSLTTANNSQFTVRLTSQECFNAGEQLQGFFVSRPTN